MDPTAGPDILDDILRLGAENSRLTARIAELERERDERLTDAQVEQFSHMLFEVWATMYHDQQTRGPIDRILQRLRGAMSGLNVPALLRDFRRFG